MIAPLDQDCGACGAEIGEECRPDCIALDSILNGIEDATNALDSPPTS